MASESKATGTGGAAAAGAAAPAADKKAGDGKAEGAGAGEPAAKKQKSHARIECRLGEVTKDNVGQLRKLNSTVFPVTYSDKFYDSVVKEDDKNIVKMAYHSDNVIGAITCRIETGVPSDTPSNPDAPATFAATKDETLAKQKRVYIMTLGVLSKYTRYGVGTELLQSVVAYVEKRKDIAECYLHVQVNNADAVAFYKRNGFEVVNTLKNYYKRIQPADCFVVSRKFAVTAASSQAPAPAVDKAKA